MKINLQELLGTKKYSPLKFTLKQSQISTSRGYQSLFASQAKQQREEPKKKAANRWQRLYSSNKKSIQEIMKIQSNQEEKQYQYYQPSRVKNDQMESIDQSRMKKPMEREKIREIVENVTSRLFKAMKCDKKNCKELENIAYYEQLKQNNAYHDGQTKPRKNRTLSETCQFLKKPSKLHNRLYWQFKERQFRNMQLQNQYEQNRIKSHQMILETENSQYLKNYISFYARLDEEVARRLKRDQYYAQNPKLGINMSDHANNFQPNITASKQSLRMISARPKITPKMQKNTIKGRAQMYKSFSITQSSEEALNKNDRILKERQLKVIKHICSIFNNDGIVDISPVNIQKLDEIQFSIFFPLLQQIEGEEEVGVQDLQQMMKQYLESLPFLQKQQVRHFRKPTHKKQKEKSNKQSVKVSQKSHRPKNEQGNAYLKKLQNFV